MILLYTSRACYNLVVLALANKSINSFDYDWYNVSDQVSPGPEPGPVKTTSKIYQPSSPRGKFSKSFGFNRLA